MAAAELSIDVTRLLRRALRGRRPTGIDRVTLAYVRHFGHRASAFLGHGRWTVELGPVLSARLFAWLLRASHGTGSMGQDGPAPPTSSRVHAGDVRLLLHTGHSGLESAAFLDALRRRGLAPVVLVHDLIPLTHPQHNRPGMAERHLARLQHAVRASAALVCNSLATRAALEGLATARGWPLPPMVVAHLGVEAWAAPAPGTHPSPPYFLCIGTLEPRKNHLLLLRVWRALAARMGEHTPDLLLAGQRGWMVDELLQALNTCPVARRHVREVPGCTDAQLRRLLAGARALVCPSVVEGFGLPVAEALACGVPVIASDLDVYREFAGEVPEYLDARDDVAWTEMVAAYCAPHSPARSAQLARLVGWQAPTWAAHFEVVEELVARLGGRGPQV